MKHFCGHECDCTPETNCVHCKHYDEFINKVSKNADVSLETKLKEIDWSISKSLMNDVVFGRLSTKVESPEVKGNKEAFLKDFAELCERHGLKQVYWMEDKSAKTSTSAYHICALYLSNGEDINGAELLKAMNVR